MRPQERSSLSEVPDYMQDFVRRWSRSNYTIDHSPRPALASGAAAAPPTDESREIRALVRVRPARFVFHTLSL
jgi:hypothetical protein